MISIVSLEIISKETIIAYMKDLEKHIGYWLRMVSNQVSGSFVKALSFYNISVAEWVVLNLLKEQTRTPATLAAGMGMTRGATSKILDKLVKKTLIYRTGSVVDKRSQDVCLSEDGLKIFPELLRIADENDFRFFGHLSEDEKLKIISLLHHVMSRNEWNKIPIN